MGWYPCPECCGPCDCACGSAPYAWEFSPTGSSRAVQRYEGTGAGDTLLGTGPWTISFWLKRTCEVGINDNGTVFSIWSGLADGPVGTYRYEMAISILNNGTNLRVELLMRDPSSIPAYAVSSCGPSPPAGCPYHSRTLSLYSFATECVGVVVRWEQHPIQLASHLTIDNAPALASIETDDDTYDKKTGGSESFYPGQFTGGTSMSGPVTSIGSRHNDTTTDSSNSKAYDDALGACVSDLRIHHTRWLDTDVEDFIDFGTIPSGTVHHWQALNPWRQDTDDLIGTGDLVYIPHGTSGYSWSP